VGVIVEIVVLELKVPAQDGWVGLHAVWPTVFLYLLTFVQIGIYWVNHHYLTSELETVDHAVLWSNLAFLFCLSLFPFVTLWAGEKHLSSFSTALYAAVSLMPAGSYTVLWGRIRRRSDAPAHASKAKQATSIALYATAIPAAYVHPALSLGLVSVVSAMWLVPPRVGADEPG
jgi:uncharacterized membrane protein